MEHPNHIKKKQQLYKYPEHPNPSYLDPATSTTTATANCNNHTCKPRGVTSLQLEHYVEEAIHVSLLQFESTACGTKQDEFSHRLRRKPNNHKP